MSVSDDIPEWKKRPLTSIYDWEVSQQTDANGVTTCSVSSKTEPDSEVFSCKVSSQTKSEYYKSVKFRDSDVFIVTYAECGDSWIERCILLLMQKEDIKDSLTGYMDTNTADSNRTCNKLYEENISENTNPSAHIYNESEEVVLKGVSSPRIFRAPAGVSLLPGTDGQEVSPIPDGVKVIFVTRNPLDACVLSYNACSSVNGRWPFTAWASAWTQGAVPQGSWWDFTRLWQEEALANPSKVLCMYYEDVNGHSHSAVKRIASFLDIKSDDTFLEKIMDSSIEICKPPTENWVQHFDSNLKDEFENLFHSTFDGKCPELRYIIHDDETWVASRTYTNKEHSDKSVSYTQSFECLKCKCAGTLHLPRHNTDGNIVEQFDINIECNCSCCQPDECVYSNIKRCISCSKEFRLFHDLRTNKYRFACPSKCVYSSLSPLTHRFISARLRSVNTCIPPWNRTLLHSAVQALDAKLVWDLLQKGADPFLTDCDGISPVDTAHAMLKYFPPTAEKDSLFHRIMLINDILPSPRVPPNLSHRVTLSESAYRRNCIVVPSSLHLPCVSDRPLPIPVSRRVSSAPVEAYSVSPFYLSVRPSIRAIDTSSVGEALRSGRQPFTPLTLARLAHGSALLSDPIDNIQDDHARFYIDIFTDKSKNDDLDWKLSELMASVVDDPEVIDVEKQYSGAYSDTIVELNCSACMDTLSVDTTAYTCSKMGCEGALCTDCLRTCVNVTIINALYAVPVIRCPGRCRGRIPTKVWRGALRAIPFKEGGDISEGNAESYLVNIYSNNANALLTMRCGGCDQSTSLFISEMNCHRISYDIESREQKFKEIIGNWTKDLQVEFLQLWLKYQNGMVPADLFIRTMYDLLIQDVDTAEKNTLNLQTKQGILSGVDDMFEPILELMTDMERRFCAQLALLRQYPKILMPCCLHEHCFMCKVEGFHEGMTCEETQEEQIGTDVQYCPFCGVPTLRTDGCDDMLCVCGESWVWCGEEY
mmetsp:Transcript_22454/g.32756  ORF Transcript_22454/g.32756 Transcript_22454/m.32756 type:complete len:988 (-) Transcript_22454:189-3152(-)